MATTKTDPARNAGAVAPGAVGGNALTPSEVRYLRELATVRRYYGRRKTRLFRQLQRRGFVDWSVERTRGIYDYVFITPKGRTALKEPRP